MVGYSTGGVISSRVFTVTILRHSLASLPSTQARVVRKLARAISRNTGIGYYAALEAVAVIGARLVEVPSSQISSKISTNSP
jgi:hypothetical protein